MLKAVIVDDEILVLNMLKNLLKTEENVQIIGEYTSPRTALELIPELKPDLVFLDIEMPGINGIELAVQILDRMEHISIVFVTAYDKYAIEAFKLNAIHYILKPPGKEDIKQVILRAVKESRYYVETKTEKVMVRLFGDISIRDESGKSLVKWPTAKTEELFVLLVLHSQNGIDKWSIIEKLWPGSQTEKVEQVLYTTVYRIKKSLEEAGIKAVIHNKLGRYTLHIENAWCDIHEFERLHETCEKTRHITEEICAQVFNLYTGELFGGRDYEWGLVHKYAMLKAFEDLYAACEQYYIKIGKMNKLEKIRGKRKFVIEQ